MAHYAKVEKGIVQTVIVAEPEYFETFVDDSPGEWIQTSYNTRRGVHYNPETNEPDDGTPLRKNYAGVGYTYDVIRDAFIPPKPFDSWILNEESCWWIPPSESPNDDYYKWDEENQTWEIIQAENPELFPRPE